MKHILAIALFIFLNITTYGQLNISDSTAQVVAYWDKNETHTYNILNNKIKIRGGDTISKEYFKYVVDISILDSSENGYLINWYYRDYNIDPKDEIMNKLSSILKNMNVQIKIDKLGAFIEVVNWLELRQYILKGTAILKKEYNFIPNMDKFIAQFENTYSTKQAIESTAINEIHQFHYFHGIKYKLNEESSYETKLVNLFGGEPFNTKVKFWLDELNPEDNNAIYRMHQSVDSTQLTNETIMYLTKMAGTLHTPAPQKESFPFLHNNTWLASRIHGSGWIVYSIQTKEVTAEDVLQIDECIIELK